MFLAKPLKWAAAADHARDTHTCEAEAPDMIHSRSVCPDLSNLGTGLMGSGAQEIEKDDRGVS